MDYSCFVYVRTLAPKVRSQNTVFEINCAYGLIKEIRLPRRIVLLGSVLQCCLHDVQGVEFSRIVPWVQKVFSFSLIPDSSPRVFCTKKVQQSDVLFGIALYKASSRILCPPVPSRSA